MRASSILISIVLFTDWSLLPFFTGRSVIRMALGSTPLSRICEGYCVTRSGAIVEDDIMEPIQQVERGDILKLAFMIYQRRSYAEPDQLDLTLHELM
ncbi:unnamed protein product [Lactuca saligna]|uniref:Uncharacterized protein n=1 Tax=Lactuca saligna TaxID=75948 RepID=A0AA35UQ91_LACSI|nr:unnamed protein product [Lactuca saligna]